MTFGQGNPTRASSEAAGHSGRFANDGNATTFWQAGENDKNAWLTIDLERFVNAGSVKLTFPSDGNWRYRVDISDDGDSGWRLISDQTQTASTAKIQTVTATNNPRGRFVRVSFTGTPDAKPAALAEVEVLGNLSGQ